jgi:hypothetical protein
LGWNVNQLSKIAQSQVAPVTLLQEGNDQFERAFQLLVQVLKQASSFERPTAASVKSRMLAASYGAFDERGLGYQTFREFLDDAAEHEVIKIIPPAPGQDYRLYLPGSATPAEHAAGSLASGSPGMTQTFSRAAECV